MYWHEISGERWQEYVNGLLKEEYGHYAVQEIPDSGGDGGVDFVVKEKGLIYQCYAAQNPVNAEDLYEKQRDKLTRDINKFQKSPKIIFEWLGKAPVKTWILFVPYCKDRRLVGHAAKKVDEVKEKVEKQYLGEGFNILIHWPSHLGQAREKFLRDAPERWMPTNPWAKVVWNSSLWPPEKKADQPIQLQLSRWVEYLHEHLLEPAAPDAPGFNPWADEEWPQRVVDRLETLSKKHLLSEGEGAWTLQEAALLLMAPFLRYSALRLVEQAAWGRLSGTLDERDPVALAFAKMLERRPQLQRKMQRLLGRGGESPEGGWVKHWLLHHALLYEPHLWDDTYSGSLLPSEWCERTRALLKGIDPHAQLFGSSGSGDNSPFWLARNLAALPEDFSSTSPHQRFPTASGVPVRTKLMGYHLAWAGRMALDPLLLPDVIVDHVGLREPLSPDALLKAVRAASWQFDQQEWGLALQCTHPAVDAALQEMVKELESLRHQAWDEVLVDLLPLKKMAPCRATGLEAARHQGIPCYRTPHIRFTLAQDEVRELLMGEQLYGDPALAIRELYQNALDACRYREIRHLAQLYCDEEHQEQGWEATYQGRRPGRNAQWIPAGEPPTEDEKKAIQEAFGWSGKILFQQGIDKERGPYISCKDNGIGMGMHELRHCFAKAGRRFTSTEEYIEEAAQWRNLGIGHYPNSQFGIGVFSYFMLAEEIDIHTRRMERLDGRGSTDRPSAIAVSISGSGSLFRVMDADQGQREGTRIYLALSRTKRKKKYSDDLIPIRVDEILKDLLWVAEFTVDVDCHSSTTTWQPNQLQHPDAEKAVSMGHRDLWWMPEGKLLSDGIVTEEDDSCLLVNLRGKNRAVLSVDRKQIVKYDDRWISEYIHQAGWKYLFNVVADVDFYEALADRFPVAFDDAWHNVRANRQEMDMDSIKRFIIEFGWIRDDKILLQLDRLREDDKEIERRMMYISSSYFCGRAIHLLSYIESEGCKRAIRTEVKKRCRSETAHLSQFRVLSPLTGACVVEEVDRGEEISPTIALSLILAVSGKRGFPPVDIWRRLKKNSGIVLPDMEDSLWASMPIPNKEDIKLLSRDLDGKRPWLSGVVSAWHIICGAGAVDWHPVEVWSRLKTYAGCGEYSLPDMEDSLWASLPIPDKEDLKLLSRDLDGRGPWLTDAISAKHIVKAAKRLKKSPEAVWEQAQRYAGLGCAMPSLEEVLSAASSSQSQKSG